MHQQTHRINAFGLDRRLGTGRRIPALPTKGGQMSSKKRRWLIAIGAVLVTGFAVTNIVMADDDRHKNPFTRILHKLDQILTKLDSGGGNGNHTLRWDTNLPAARRFVVLEAFNNEAVLDHETGLVWERSPDPTVNGHTDWRTARSECINRHVGGTRGWRLPSMAELASVMDPSLPAPFVPANVFSAVQSAQYWSATQATDFETYAWVVNFSASGEVYIDSKGHEFQVWCVRGGMNADAY